MALEDQFRSLTDKLDGLFGSFFSRQQAGQENLTNRLENAVSQGFGSVQDAVSEVDGGIEADARPQRIEEQVESINTSITSGLGDAVDAIGEVSNEDSGDLVQNLISDLEGDFSLAGTDAIEQDLNRLEEVFSTLSSSAEISEDQLQGFASVFEQFGEQVNEVEEQVSAGQISVQDAQQEVQELAGQVQEEFENITGDRFENFDQSVQDLVDLSQQFSRNIQEAADIAQDAQGAAFGQDAVSVAGAVSEIGGGGLSFVQTLQTRVADAASVLTEGTENLQPLGSAVSNLQEIDTGDLAEVNTISGAISTRTSTILTNISAARVVLAGILAPLAIASDLLEDVFNVARDFRQETGIGAERMRELRAVTADVSSELAGFGLEPSAVGDVALSLVERFGSLETATFLTGRNLETITKRAGRLAGSLGVSAERGSKIFETFLKIGSSIGGSVESAIGLTNQFAEAAEVAPQKAFEQITENAQQLVQFSGNTTESLARAAVQAQKLGTNLGTVADFQEQSLTDITGQVQKLQEAQMLTGQQFNSTALISASYQGTEETLSEITEQLEGLDFSSLDFFQRQALQEAFPGFSLGELKKLSRGQEILEETNTTLARARAIGAGDLTFAQAIQADDVDEVERIRRQFNQLYFVIAENLFPVVSDILGLLTDLTPVIRFIGNILKGASSAVRLLTGSFQALEVPVRLVQAAVFGTEESFEKLDESVQNLGETLSSVFEPFDRLLNYFGILKKEGERGAENISLLNTSLESLGTLLGAYEIASVFTGLPSVIGGITSKLGGLMGGFKRFIPFMSTASDEVATATKTVGKLSSTAENTGGVLSRLSGKFSGMLPKLSRMGNLFINAGRSVGGFLTRLPLLGPALTAVSGAFGKAAASVYTFATSLTATGIGAIILGIAAAIGGAVYAFYNWEETVRFLSDTFDSFMSSAFGVKNATEEIMPTLSTVGDFFVELGGIIAGATIGVFQGLGTAIYALGDAFLYTTLQLDHIVDFVGFMAGKIGSLISSFYEGKSAGEALGSTLGLIFNPFGDYINFMSEIIGLFYDLGSAIAQGNFSDIGSILLEGLEGIGQEFVDMIIPDGIQSYVAEKMEGLTSTITSYLPFSPAETGPLSNLDQVNIGGEVARTIQKEPVEREMQKVGSTAVQATGEAAEAGQVGVQAEGPGVATVDQNVATGPQQAAATAQQAGTAQAGGETQEVRIDSETDDVKGVLQEILNTQKQLLSDLRDGNIAVYLDGRKVNKELVRGLGLTN